MVAQNDQAWENSRGVLWLYLKLCINLSSNEYSASLLSKMASTLDLLPTILNLVGVEPKQGVVLDGYDMSPILFEGKKVRVVNN